MTFDIVTFTCGWVAGALVVGLAETAGWLVEVVGAAIVVLLGDEDECAVFVLDNPDAADTPIRALGLAIVTVAGRAA